MCLDRILGLSQAMPTSRRASAIAADAERAEPLGYPWRPASRWGETEEAAILSIVQLLQGSSGVRKSESLEGKQASNEVLLQPWFLPQRVQQAIRSLVPSNYWHTMRDFFDDYGCMVCGADQGYKANGMCHRCYERIKDKVRASARRRLKSTQEQRIDLDLLRKAKIARKLLARFSAKNRATSERRRIDTARSGNPVDEALGPTSEALTVGFPGARSNPHA
jgi:hypothetical protein